MYIATWNLNNRVGMVPFRPESSNAAVALGADVLVFTEFFPKEHEQSFRSTLADAGLSAQLISAPSSERANRVFVASKLPLAQMALKVPTFDQQFPANLLGVTLPSVGLSLLCVLVPWYVKQDRRLLSPAWEWLETASVSLKNKPSIIIGDLNIETSSRSQAGKRFQPMLTDGWHRAESGGPTCFGIGKKPSEIDHILATQHCVLSETRCVRNSRVSDHAALVCRIELSRYDKDSANS